MCSVMMFSLNRDETDFCVCFEVGIRAGLRGGATGAIAPGPPLQGGPRDDIYLF